MHDFLVSFGSACVIHSIVCKDKDKEICKHSPPPPSTMVVVLMANGLDASTNARMVVINILRRFIIINNEYFYLGSDI